MDDWSQTSQRREPKQPSSRQATQIAARESLRNAKSLFESGATGAGVDRTTKVGLAPEDNRYDTCRFNVLRGTNRDVLPESLKMGDIGANGLHRYDAKPQGAEGNKYQLADYYMKELKDKKGTTDFQEGPLFIVKGLHNYSNLPSGDLRVSRGTTTLHEQFIHPQDRAPVPPRHQHLQRTAAEPVDDDIGLGPVTMSEGTMGGGNTTAYDDAMFAKRTRVYREATELHLPKELDDLEVIMRDKIDQYAGSSKGDVGYQVKSSFRFFDRDARGVIDLVMFREALRKMGLKVDEMTAVALFARYDINRNGFVNYHEYIKNLLSKDYVSKNDSATLARRIKDLLEYLKAEGSFHGLTLAAGEETKEDILALTDEEFMERQRLKKIFCVIDTNNSGTLEFNEFRRLLKLVGAICNPAEEDMIFNYVDGNRNGHITFKEFFDFYSLEPPPPVKAMRSDRAATREEGL